MLVLLKYFSVWNPPFYLAHLPWAFADELFEQQRIQYKEKRPVLLVQAGSLAFGRNEARKRPCVSEERLAALALAGEPHLGFERTRAELPGLRENERSREEELFLKPFRNMRRQMKKS
jgi:hypothetical protein